jgi:glucose-6-phosphate isomerase
VDKKISIDYSYTNPFIDDSKIDGYMDEVKKAMNTLLKGTGSGADFLGWRELPNERLQSQELSKIIEVGNEINEKADLLICVGIGGSYLGAKAVLEALSHPFYNYLSKNDRKGPKILFAGQNISGSWLSAVLDEIDKVDSVYVNVISKSGTTTEPGIAFRSLKSKLEKKYGKIEAAK